MTKQEAIDNLLGDEKKFFLMNELVVNVEDTKGCFNLLGALLLNTTILPVEKADRDKKIKLSKEFIHGSKAIQLWGDCAGYDESVLKKRLLLNINKQIEGSLKHSTGYGTV